MTSSISLKSLLPHIDIKQDLTVYLAEKKIASGDAYKKDVIIYETVTESNLAEFPEQMQPNITKKQTR